MSTLVDLFPQEMQSAAAKSPAVAAWPEESSTRLAPWGLESFAKEQIRGLVRQLFCPGPAPLKQIVFSGVDLATEVLPVCLQVGEALGQHSSGTVCVVEAARKLECGIAREGFPASSSAKRFGTLRDLSEQISSSLWFMSADIFWGTRHDFSAVWLRARLAELRLEFDYTVLQGPAAGHSEAAALAGLSDGLVLVLQANLTRRVTAQKVKERLSAANTRLLGTVLTGRTFPIPEAIYKRL